MTQVSSCQVSTLTPPGRGAVATLLLTGDDAVAMADRFFRPLSGRPLRDVPIGRIVFGRWQSDEAQPGEEVVVCRVTSDRLELHCHGGRAAVQAVIEALVSIGSMELSWQDVAFAEDEEVIKSEARVALAAAKTHRTAAILLDQFNGALRSALQSIEAQRKSNDVEASHQGLAKLNARADLGLHLTKPFWVVFAGRPNVGKSSLVNAILGYSRAIVFDQPGTTRDVLTATTAIDGWPVELTDTAGLRHSDDDLEQQGAARARQIAAAADLVALVIDVSQPVTKEDSQLINSYPQALIVFNKCDLPTAARLEVASDISVSAVTGENLPELMALIAGRLVPSPPSDGEAVPFTQRQVDSM